MDTNVLIYAHRRESTLHEAAANLLRELAEGSARWAVPWPCVYEFFGVVTNPRIWKDSASTPAQAIAQLDAWRRSPTCSLLAETEGTWSLLCKLTQQPRVRGGVVHEARIAAVCLSHGVDRLLSVDRDFSLFPALRTGNPLR